VTFTDGDASYRRELLNLYLLTELGHSAEAESSLENAISRFGRLPEICLAAANVERVAANGKSRATDSLRLNWINTPFSAAGLAPLAIGDAEHSLTFDNVSGARVSLDKFAKSAKVSIIMP